MPVRTASARRTKKAPRPPPHRWLVHIQGNEKDLRRFLTKHPLEIQGVARKGLTWSLRVILPSDLLEALHLAGLQYGRGPDLTALGEKMVHQVGPGTGFDPALLSLGLTAPAQVEYLTCSAVAQAAADLAGGYPSCCELLPLPEKTVAGTLCQYISIAKKAPAGAPAILILGGIHGREWGSCEIALHFAEQLLATYNNPGTDLVIGAATFTAAEIKTLVETRQIIVFPLVNPDGRDWSQSGMDTLWRKNRNPAQADPADPGSIGVDINRNFDFMFNLGAAFRPNAGLQVSTNPSDELYQGKKPFSEVETRNVLYLLDRFTATSWLVDLHSSSQTVMCPWTVDETQTGTPQDSFVVAAANSARGIPADNYAEYMRPKDEAEHARLRDLLAQGIVAAGGPQYARKTGFEFGASSGTSHDYAFSRHLVSPNPGKVLGFVVEWGTLPYPDWVDMQRILPQVSAGLLRFCIATQHPLP